MRTKMESSRKTAIIVGVLFILGTVAGILSVVTTGHILGVFSQHNPDYLTKAATNETQMIIGSVFLLIMGLALALIPVVIYPVLKKYNQVLALGYIVFRGALETFITITMVIIWLLVLTLGQDYVKAGTPVAPYFYTMGNLLLNGQDWLHLLLEIVFPIGALMFYFSLYQSRLIPRWLSGWGFIGGILYLAAGVIAMFSSELTILLIPLGIQEMVMAVWLIIKGFDPVAIDSGS